MPEDQRAWWLAREKRRRDLHDECGHPRSVCGDGERTWYPQLTVCRVTMEQQAAWEAFSERHEERPYHDGTYKSWAQDRSNSHPYHFRHGTSIWVAETDYGLGGDFLGPAGVGVDEPDAESGQPR